MPGRQSGKRGGGTAATALPQTPRRARVLHPRRRRGCRGVVRSPHVARHPALHPPHLHPVPGAWEGRGGAASPRSGTPTHAARKGEKGILPRGRRPPGSPARRGGHREGAERSPPRPAGGGRRGRGPRRGVSPRGRRAGSPGGRGASSRAAAGGRRGRAPRIAERVPPGAGGARAAEEEETAAAPELGVVITGCCGSPETSGAGVGPGGAREPPALQGGLRREAGPNPAEGRPRAGAGAGARRAWQDAGRQGGAGAPSAPRCAPQPMAVRERLSRRRKRGHPAGLAPPGGKELRRLENTRTPASASHLHSDCVALTRKVTVS